MIPDDPQELQLLAGEYVLGVLEPAAAAELEAALPGNDALRRAVALWHERLHPLSALAPAAEPPPDLWQRIESAISGAAPVPEGWWNSLPLWRWSTAIASAAAACLALYVALAPPISPRYVAVLHAPQQGQPVFVATGGARGLAIHAVAQASAPADRGFELWAIAAGGKPISLGMLPESGRLELAALPTALSAGLTLAITIEPRAGAPHAAPSAAPVFVGTLAEAR